MRKYTGEILTGTCTKCGAKGVFKQYRETNIFEVDGINPSFYECPKCKWGCLDYMDYHKQERNDNEA